MLTKRIENKVLKYSQKALGLKISYYRECNKMSQKDLERKSGISQSYIACIESGKGKTISLQKLIKIAEALNVSLDDLLWDSLTKLAENQKPLENKTIANILDKVTVLSEEQTIHFYKFLYLFLKYKNNAFTQKKKD